MKSEENISKDFIRRIIDEDVKNGKNGGKVVTRFPPEPNGFLHIGHAKSICLNFGLAEEYKSVCHLRFDDTDPTKEDMLYESSIQEDILWLGFDWQGKLFHASDYFEKFYECALSLIKEKKAYVCGLTEEEIREHRGTVTEPGKISPFAKQTVEENLRLFEEMKAGKYPDGKYVLRARIDMAASNMKMRDPLIYRIRHSHHYRTGNQWCIYPMYDFAHPLSDAIEGITHSICTLEFENNRELYDWFLDQLPRRFPTRPRQYEFARLSLQNTVMSKRKLLELVENKVVDGWDDPRLPTIAGMRRRGITPEAIRAFCKSVGIAKANSTVDPQQLDFCIRDDLNTKAKRVMAVLDPVKVVIENFPEGEVEELEASYWPHDIPKTDSRKVYFSKEIYIERSDFLENPPKGFFRLAPGKEVRLRYGYCITCTSFEKDPETGAVTLIKATFDPETKSGQNPIGRKVKGTIHWVGKNAIPTKVRLYDSLLIDSEINPNSLQEVSALLEHSLKTAEKGERFQFERQGYFILDQKEPVFNRIVTLKSSWKPEK